MRKNLMIVVAMLAVITGCQSNPAPPTANDAKAVWNNINKKSGLGGVVELIDLKKTDGQMAEVNGTKVYTLFYDARERHLTKLGKWKPGDVETYKSNYGFQKTENGWQGPDGEHFPN